MSSGVHFRIPLMLGHVTALAVSVKGTPIKHHYTGGVLKCLPDNNQVSFSFRQLYDENETLFSLSSLYHYVASLSVVTVLSLLISLYLTAAILYSLIAWYKFLSAWNLILRARRFDNLQLRRRMSSHKLMQSQVHVDAMSEHLACPICLVDFFETELVTACDGGGGCGNWFHRHCLVEWLDRSDSCPCCRKNLLSNQQRQINMADMARSCFGFVTR